MYYLGAVSLILNIDTAIEIGSVCLAKDQKNLGIKINPSQKDSAAWLQPAIHELLKEQSFSINDIDAVAVSSGPGSYTGLRVGMATAKGLSYALGIPLIAINTLQMMAAGAIDVEADMLCPMIDARRMEVFAAIYDKNLNELLAPHNCIIDSESFKSFLEKGTIVFFGNGSDKMQPVVSNPNAIFKKIETTAEQMVLLSYQHFQMKKFEDVAYVEPQYGKEFYTPSSRKI